MKIIALITVGLLATGCTSQVKIDQPIALESIPGCYSAYDGSGYNVFMLNLMANHSFTARHRGDIGDWGTAKGNWKIDGNAVILDTTSSVDTLKTLSGPIYIYHYGSKYALSFNQKAEINNSRWGRFDPVACGSN